MSNYFPFGFYFKITTELQCLVTTNLKYCTSHPDPQMSQLAERRELTHLGLLADPATIFVDVSFPVDVDVGVAVRQIISHDVGPRTAASSVDAVAMRDQRDKNALK